ncbi:hypothetical protein YQE_02558, partial [Dendroctonus ponderosae]
MDIVSYLVLTHSYYTKEQMKCYKSFKVKHSLRPKAKPLEVWCIITKDGTISTAHCTCMAGSGEVCSHVGALLFAAEYANRRREETSCTDVLNAWMMPTGPSNISLLPVRDMNWAKPYVASKHYMTTQTPNLRDILQ